ncbi:exopolyphosphatase / guanosine-5'-triphosphate,3'-diphosphate pyrophosphatase [Arboricoccus pini]|uniref:Exopolyphosphatase / guanosine-5'-triphosphate,3'-diphosphate pyrophosphatase n=1 Tax=Arboricoccus pini TaxID=1963835 RepID=A0A212QNT5_9PROT|nr:exopolyphosphatase [Arboricoccus pini]SNB61050.1 exopolyphosphatase / guanosine-5'-triphosphate,3'-diphosphate pyrophosphatase [Arboricoccus pini]
MTKHKLEPFAVVDLGSNSIRLVVYDGLTRAPVTRFNERRLCGLGREVARYGKLGRAGRKCALDSLKRFTAIAKGVGCSRIDIIATAAVRLARDGASFVKQAEKTIGQKITVLSGQEEAHFGALGVTCGFFQPAGIMGDLGGGSVEFAAVPSGRRFVEKATTLRSLPLGTLIVGEAIKAGGLTGASDLVARAFAEYPDLDGLAAGKTFYVVGGSWRALARARMTMTNHPLRIVHGFELRPDEAIDLGREISLSTDVASIPGLPRKRAGTAVAAGLMLSEVVGRLKPARVVFSATGVREGRVFALLKRKERHRDPLLAAAEDLGRVANRSAHVGKSMIEWSNTIFATRETAAWKRLREAACHVSDASWREHPDTRAQEAFLRLVQYPFLGIDHVQRISLAHIVYARYGGDRRDPAITHALEFLDDDQIRSTELVGRVLELGYRLSGGAPEILEQCRLALSDSVLILKAPHDAVIEDDEAITSRLAALASAFDLEDVAIEIA